MGYNSRNDEIHENLERMRREREAYEDSLAIADISQPGERMNFARYRMISSTDAFPRPGIFLRSAGFMKSRRSGASIEQSISVLIVRSLKPLCRNGNGSNTGRADVRPAFRATCFCSSVRHEFILSATL